MEDADRDAAPPSSAARLKKRRGGRIAIGLRRLLPPAPALIEIELIGMLFATTASIKLMGIATAFVTALALLSGHPRPAAFCAVIVVISIFRLATVRRFHRASPRPLATLGAARSWERRFAYGSYAAAFALGVASFVGLRLGDPVIGILIIGALFAYAFLVVLRLGVRPRVCAISILLAVVPSAAGLPALFDTGTIISREFAATALLTIFVILIASAFGMMVHSYQLTLDQLKARRDLTRMARQDPLTGLLNRLALRERFDIHADALSDGPLLAVHYLDLDRFKAVNDLNGHSCGDLLLVEVAQRLRQCLTPADDVFRLGGDEFVILQVGIAGRAPAAALAQRIIATIADPHVIDGVLLDVGISIGIAIAPPDGRELDDLLASADAALYRAKLAGGGLHRFWADAAESPVRLHVA